MNNAEWTVCIVWTLFALYVFWELRREEPKKEKTAESKSEATITGDGNVVSEGSIERSSEVGKTPFSKSSWKPKPPKPEPVLTKEQEKFVTIIQMGLDIPRCTVCNARLLRDYKNKRFWCDAGHEQGEEEE